MQDVITPVTPKHKAAPRVRKLHFERFFTKEGVHPYDEIKWELRDARITDTKGKTVFLQENVEVPEYWSQNATNIVVQKYFRGKVGTPERETSARQIVNRVAKTMAGWGRKASYFASEHEAQIYEEELTYILIHQMAAFNSPVWFNVGIFDKPQCSACFINSVEDNMESIMQLARDEAMIFKGGSGSGVNLSPLRSSKEFLGGSNGRSSGPVSFMKGLDSFAGVIKSGGKTRRAAKMVILDIDHPDVVEFIRCKAEEEKKAHALIDAGYDGSMDGAAYSSVYFQNANNSVRVSDDFMRNVESDGKWTTHMVTTGEAADTYNARDLMKEITQAAWFCGDPGMQFDTTINRWHTCKNTDRIYTSNPCSEFMFLNKTACNLASINLMKFRNEDGSFDVAAFSSTAKTIITAMEISVDFSSYPTPAMTQNSYDYRPLGIGYANLGALLMSIGLPYDSDEGRAYAAAITSLMSAVTYFTSSEIANDIGPFPGYKKNEQPFNDVMRMHRDASYEVKEYKTNNEILVESQKVWDKVVLEGRKNGFRNSQISVLAPTGTISFIMDCQTTGIEPDLAVVKYKFLVGGGMVKMVNEAVPGALKFLGYTQEQMENIQKYINEHDTIEGAPDLKEEHLSVFDCAFKAKNGTRTIHYMGHIRMMGAVQPFISGAISKTVNLPTSATEQDIAEVYMEAWRLGLKALAIYRDGCKRTQPIGTDKADDGFRDRKTKKAGAPAQMVSVAPDGATRPYRRKLPDDRQAITHKFNIGGQEGFITVGMYEDGTPGELFINMSKEGSTMSGMLDAFSISISYGLQYGVPLKFLVNKFAHVRFEPSGFTTNPNIRMAKSLVDYIFRWLALKFLTKQECVEIGIHFDETVEDIKVAAVAESKAEEDSLNESKAKVAAVMAEPVNPAQTKLEFGEKPKAASVTLAEEKTPGTIPANEPFSYNKQTVSFDMQSDAPACATCGNTMVRNAACYKCLNCGATSGCS
jgi:ribonucleoside-diphosphate reductase alpha chain